MKKTLLSIALVLTGLFAFSAAPANAQEISFGVHGGRGGFSFHYDNGGRHNRGHYDHGRRHYPRPVYRAPITVTVYEYSPRYHRTVPVVVTAYWSNYYHAYVWYDRFGNARIVGRYGW